MASWPKPRGRGRSTGMISAMRPGRGDITTTRSASSTASGNGMGDEDHGHLPPLPDAQQFQAHFLPRQGIQRAEGFIHEQHPRVLQQRPADGHALLHAAGQLARQPVLEAGQSGGRQQRPRPRLGVPAGLAHQPQREGHVAQHDRPRAAASRPGTPWRYPPAARSQCCRPAPPVRRWPAPARRSAGAGSISRNRKRRRRPGTHPARPRARRPATPRHCRSSC